MEGPPHRPVMAGEVLAALDPVDGGMYVDGTVGAAGHARLILEASAPGGRLLGLDRDPAALALAAANLAPFGARAILGEASFDEMDRYLAGLAPQGADGILLDLGVSSMQLDRAERGFAFRQDAPLDMRMGPRGETAAQLLARLDEAGLTRLLREYGEEPLAPRVARALVRARERAPIATTGQLARLVEDAVPMAVKRKQKTHPATRVFQALRIAVNDELGRLARFLELAPRILRPGGVLAILSYHSLEDRLVKKAIAGWARPCTCPPEFPRCVCGRRPLFTPLVRKAGRPDPREVAGNPRARSARLRAARRTEAPA